MDTRIEVIGIDHGWSMMKSVSEVFVTGIKEITTIPALYKDTLEYKGANVYIDTLTYDEFKMLGDMELGRRFTKLDEKEQKDKVNRELGNELEFMDESQKADNSSSGGTGGNSLGSRQVVVREKTTWEDTISNRMLHWNYSSEQKEEVKKAIAAGISKTKIMEYFYPDVSIELMRTYREAQVAMH